MVGKSNIIPRGTGKKHWRDRIKTTFDIPAKRMKRRMRRKRKAAALFPRPVKKLVPVVRCCHAKYNMKLRHGKGFSIQECKAVGIKVPYARTIGISVDLRRKNRNEEEFQRNVVILKDYYKRLTLIPTNPKKEIDGVVLKEYLKTNKFDEQQGGIVQPEISTEIAFRALTEEEKTLKKKTAVNKRLTELKKARKHTYGLQKEKNSAKKKGKKGGNKKKK